MANLSRHHVQWAAQFAVASELCKRGCEVSFTMGNCAPLADLIVGAPSGELFYVDVKGQRTRNFWRIKQKPSLENLYYIFCFIGDPTHNRFFCFSQSELTKEMTAYQCSGVKFDEKHSGINLGAADRYEDRWEVLPLN